MQINCKVEAKKGWDGGQSAIERREMKNREQTQKHNERTQGNAIFKEQKNKVTRDGLRLRQEVEENLRETRLVQQDFCPNIF